MLPCVFGSNLIICNLLLLDFTDDAVDDFNRLKINRLFVAALIIDNSTEALSFVCKAVFVNAVNNSADFEDAVFIGKILVFLSHNKKCGKH